MQTKPLLFLAAFVVAFGVSHGAKASLINQDITCSATVNTCNPASATVGGGQEFVINAGVIGDVFGIDVGDSSVQMTFLLTGSFQALGGLSITLGDLIWSNDPLATILDIDNFSSSNVSGMVAGDVTPAGNALTIDYSNTFWDPGSFISFDLVTSHSAIPEPPALFLFGVGLALILWWSLRAPSSPGRHRERHQNLFGHGRPSLYKASA